MCRRPQAASLFKKGNTWFFFSPLLFGSSSFLPSLVKHTTLILFSVAREGWIIYRINKAMLFQSVGAKLPYRGSSKEADGFTWQAWGDELGYRSRGVDSQWRPAMWYLSVGGENTSTPHSWAGTLRLLGLSYLSAETIEAIKAHELVYRVCERAW